MRHKITFTQNGLEKFIKEYEELNAKRPALVAELSRARDMGDRSENAAYKSARHHLSTLDRRLRHLKKVIDQAEVTTLSHNDFVEIGHSVKLQIDDAVVDYTVVGGYESDLTEGKISCHSPIGKSLLHKKKGDTFLVHVPAGKKVFKVLDITS